MNRFKGSKDSGGRPTICHVLHTLNVGGAELLASEFARQAADRFRAVFVCLDSAGSMGEKLREEGFKVEVVERRPGFDRRCAWRMARFMKREDVRLVHAHQYGPFFYASVARMLGTRIPVLFTEHGRDYPDFCRKKRVWANKILLGRRDRVVAVGDYVKSALVKNEGIASNRIEVVFNGVDASLYDSNQHFRSEVRAELGLADSDVAIVQVARLNRLKDFETAVRAMSIVCKSCPQVQYVIIGEGEERESIERLILELGLEQNVKLLGLRSDVPRLLQGMDIFMLSSLTEGIPLTLVESMLANLPSVVTGVGGIPEVVVDGITGLMAEPQNPSELALKLVSLVQSPSARLRMGSVGRKRALDMFNAERMFARYNRIYAELTNLRLSPTTGDNASQPCVEQGSLPNSI